MASTVHGDRSRLIALGVAVVVALLASLLVNGSAADAGRMSEDVSGSFTDTAIDTSGGGNAANLISGITSSGRTGAHYEGIWEIELLGPSDACDGLIEGAVVAYSIVRRYPNGDLLYSQLDAADPGSTCFDPAGVADLTINAVVTGGTGQFAGATGSYTAEYDVQLLLPDPGGGIAHGSFTGTVEGSH